MKPISLRLVGFSGIRAGLGRDELTLDLAQVARDAKLVALAGPNGIGKTTVMDNLTPYRVMPSRAGGDALGAFSYYEHLCLPEAVKDLRWEHHGELYRSQLVLRQNGKRKSEAYLHIWRDGAWAPVRLDDGTVSDGKSETYDQCVEAILGSAATFFTSVFAAQGRRPLSSYRNAEVKTLLADLLGLDDIREMGREAAEVAKLLRAGLGNARAELVRLDRELADLSVQHAKEPELAKAVDRARAQREAATAAVEAAQQTLAQVKAEAEIAAHHEAMRERLAGDRRQAERTFVAGKVRLEADAQRAEERKTLLAKRIAGRARASQLRRDQLSREQSRLSVVLAQRDAIARGARHAPRLTEIVARRAEILVSYHRHIERLGSLEPNAAAIKQRIASIEREAGQAELNAQDLEHRLSLTAKVPCSGTDLQGRCQLLADAREARALMPSAQGSIGRLHADREVERARLCEMQIEIQELLDFKEKARLTEAKLKRSRMPVTGSRTAWREGRRDCTSGSQHGDRRAGPRRPDRKRGSRDGGGGD